MTVSKPYAPSRTVGNGTTSQFTADWKVDDTSEPLVYLIDTAATTNKTLQVEDTDYSVTINESTENATIKFLLANPPSTKDALIERDIEETQPTDIPDVALIRENILETGYDRSVRLIQQLSEKIGRQLVISVEADTSATYDLTLPEAVDDKILAWSVSGSNASIVNSVSNLSDFDGAVTSAQAAANQATSSATISTTQAGIATSQAVIATSQAGIATNAASQAATNAGLAGIHIGEWNCTSDTQVVISSGFKFTSVASSVVYTFQSNITMDITGSVGSVLGLNTGTEASNTHYYIIALADSTATNNPSAWFVTESNYASFTVSDLPSGYDDYKRIGSIRNDNSGNFIHGSYVDHEFFLDDPETYRKSHSNAGFTDIDWSDTFPAVVRTGDINFHRANSSASWRINGSTSAGVAVIKNTGTANSANQAKVRMDSSQIFEASASGADVLYMEPVSYKDDLKREGQ